MKKHLSVLLLALLGTIAHAQNFELGANAGATKGNSLSDFHSSPIIEEEVGRIRQSDEIAPYLSLKGIYNIKKWQVGVTVAYSETKIDYFIPGGNLSDYNAKRVESFFPVQVSLAHKFVFHHIEAYGGLSTGYMFTGSGIFGLSKSNSDHNTFRYNYIGGIQIGATYFITKKIGINIELAGNYIHINTDEPDTQYSSNHFFTMVTCLGIRYKL